jgi:hypothetical protein
MITFTINDDNNIVAYTAAEEAAQAGDPTATSFDSLAALAELSAEWPLSRFIELWNSLPGQTPVKKFTNRKTAAMRIWKAIQPLGGNGQPSERAEPAAEAPEMIAANPEPKRGRKQAKPAKPAKKAAGAKKAADKPKGDRANKKAEVIAMMKRAKGATLAEIMEHTGWQPHTVRGFVSILGSKGGETIESTKSADGERTYKIAK